MTGTTMANARRFAVQHWAFGVWCMVIGLCVGLAGVMVIGRTLPPPYWLVWGGNTDPNDDDGVGAREQLIDGGWVSADNITQVRWAADISQGTARISDEAMAEAHSQYEAHCRGAQQCILAGFSLGNSPALELAAQVGHPAELTYTFGAPQPAPGVFHNAYLDNPGVEPYFVTFSGLYTDRPVAAGAQNFYGIADPYGNAAPQCAGPGLFALSLNDHRIVTKQEADESNIWTGPDGVVNHEVGVPGVVVSGSQPSPPWNFCPPGGWYSPTDTRANPGPAPGVPGAPDTSAPSSDEVGTEVPGIPGAPDQGGLPEAPSELPGVPALPGG